MMGLLLALSLSSLVPGIVLVGGCVGSFFIVVVKLDMGSFRRVHVHVDIWNGGRKKRHVCDFLLNWLGFDRRESQFFRAHTPREPIFAYGEQDAIGILLPIRLRNSVFSEILWRRPGRDAHVDAATSVFLPFGQSPGR
jgi:hypothetical protein